MLSASARQQLYRCTLQGDVDAARALAQDALRRNDPVQRCLALGCMLAAEQSTAQPSDDRILYLEDVGGRRIQVIKTLRVHLGLGLRECVELTEQTPTPLSDVPDHVDLTAFAEALREAGATVRLNEGLVTSLIASLAACERAEQASILHRVVVLLSELRCWDPLQRLLSAWTRRGADRRCGSDT